MLQNQAMALAVKLVDVDSKIFQQFGGVNTFSHHLEADKPGMGYHILTEC